MNNRINEHRLEPQPGPQTEFLSLSHIFELFYGGAKAGGKSFALLLDWERHQAKFGADANGLLVRRTLTELKDLIYISIRMFTPLKWRWYTHDSMWVTPEGARLQFAHLENEDDATRFYGWNLNWIGVDELTTFESPKDIMTLKGCFRTGFNPNMEFCFRCTGMPGGKGHAWVKKRYIDPGPRRLIIDEHGLQRMWIPAKAKDNKFIDQNYVARLRQSAPNKEVERGWIDGDWNIIAGAYFHDFNYEKHTLDDFRVPLHWDRFMAFDWGFNTPSACLWIAVVPDTFEYAPSKFLPRGSLIVYKELYLAKNHDNSGLDLAAEGVAKLILDSERYQGARLLVTKHNDKFSYQIIPDTKWPEPLNEDGGLKLLYRVADPSIRQHGAGQSVRERMARCGLRFRDADNTRTPEHGHGIGWNMVRYYLTGDDGIPLLYFFRSCIDLIETFPALQVNPERIEDVLKGPRDHLGDALRYACMSRRPYVPNAIAKQGLPLLMAGNDPVDEEEFYAHAKKNGIQVLKPPALERESAPKLSLFSKRRIQ